MKTLFRILVFIAFSSGAFAQQSNLQTDSHFRLPELPDSLKSQYQKIDSIRTDFNVETSKIQGEYQNGIAAIDKNKNALTHQIDSLNNLKLPTSHLTSKLDSLEAKRNELTSKTTAKLSDLKSKTVGKLDKIELTPEMQGPAGELTNKINGLSLSDGKNLNIPSVDVPGFTMPKLDNNPLNELDALKEIKTPLGEIGNVTGQLDGVGADVKTLASGDLKQIGNLSTVEQQAQNIDGIKELQSGNQVIDGYQKQLDVINNPDAAKEKVMEMAQKQAVDHFAGKEEALQSAMSQVAKYKKKYANVSSIHDLPKRAPNAMKGKPFIERFIPGMYLQYQQKNAYVLDVNPYGSYRLSGIFSSGIGWNHRIVVNNESKTSDKYFTIFGPRIFFDGKIGKGFIGHVETEYMKTFVPSKLTGTPDVGRYEWISSSMIGLKKEYTIYKHLKGTVLFQYNLYNRHFKAPYVDRVNSRIGFEYILRKKVKQQTR